MPPGVQQHLSQRAKDRQITADEIRALRAWIDLQPEVPNNDWYRDFGSFILCGHGPYLKTFLVPDQIPYGTKLD